MGSRSFDGKGHFRWGRVPLCRNVPTTGECACPAHAADECISRFDGRQDGDAASWQITSDNCST